MKPRYISKAVGDAFESWLDAQHEMAKLRGILFHVEHNQPHTRVLGGRVVYTGAGVADYTGICKGGRALGVEAKSTSALKLSRSAIRPLQARHLTAVAKAGGLALLLVEFRTQSGFSRFAVPWLKVPWKVLRTAESVTAADIEEWRIIPGTCYLERF